MSCLLTFFFCALQFHQDVVVAVDCRGFSDPQRSRHRHDRAQDNHLGYHHTVLAGLRRGGAKVWDPKRNKNVNLTLREFWIQFVAQPLWDGANKVAIKMRQLQASKSAVVPRLLVVFVCKYGRHRSVALQRCLVHALAVVPWANLCESSHLASHSWQHKTCNQCRDYIFTFVCLQFV